MDKIKWSIVWRRTNEKEKGTMGVRGEEKEKPKRSRKVSSSV